jgi:hypothetical protein
LRRNVFIQLPVLRPQSYSEQDVAFVNPRVVELSYTSNALKPLAEKFEHSGQPFRWDPSRRALLHAELDAYYAYLYGLTQRELEYILDPRAVKRALDLLHFAPDSGEPQADWDTRCRAACYHCLLSYSNQADHRHLDRQKVRDFLLSLSRCDVAPVTEVADYEEAYRRLLGLIDPVSSFERAFLDHLYKNRLRLPDHAQHTPADGIAVQPDFYYERNGIAGGCIFIDGPHHDNPTQMQRDHEVREALKDQGFRVIAIRSGRAIAEQLAEHPDIFRKH